MTTAEAPSDAVTLSIGGRYWDPKKTYADDAARTNYILITTRDPLKSTGHAILVDLNVRILEYVGSDTYLCFYEPPDLGPIRRLEFVRQVDVFRSKFKIVQDLKDTNLLAASGVEVPVAGLASTSLTESAEVCTVDIVLHEGQDVEDVLPKLCEQARVDQDMVEHTSRKIRMTVDRTLLKQIATQDCIRVIEEVVPKSVHNNLARDIMEADIVINNTPYHGEGQIITVSDTGFDMGDKERCHPAFQDSVLDLVSIVPPPTKAKAYPLDPRLPQYTRDLEGHGTHVCGSIVGRNMASIPYGEDAVGGVAQKAKLIVQSMYYKETSRPGIRTPLDLTDGLFDPPYYKAGCRIFTNSWGDNLDEKVGQRMYSKSGSEEVDEFVWRTGDAVVLFSAGNDNVRMKGKASIGSQPSAKNCITVGATGSKRDPKDGKEHESMYSCSSRGPTKEGRIKPDVVAPGVDILSTSTQVPDKQKNYKDAYQYDLEYEKTRKPVYDPYFRTESGTSMATPLVAGCVAILREVLSKYGVPNPSAALVKALLINGAEFLDGIPQEAQGFGRVNLKKSVAMIQQSKGVQGDGTASPSGFLEGKALKQGEIATISILIPEIEVATATGKLKVTLAYSDVPGPMLQNNLVLTVAIPGSVERNGNGYSGAEFDAVNNVEQVTIDDVRSGVLEVRVWAQKITQADQSQKFGLAWSYM